VAFFQIHKIHKKVKILKFKTFRGSDGKDYQEKYFRIHPFLFSLATNDDPNNYEFTLQFFFYSFYLSIWDTSRKFFLLPLLLYYSFSGKDSTTMWFLFGGLLFSYSEPEKYKYIHVLPIYFERDNRYEKGKQFLIRLLFPLYWKFKTEEVSFATVLPLYYYYKSPTYYLNHLLLFFGYVMNLTS
jgi:hypothetical protein